MSIGRRKVRLEDTEAWVFNRIADEYEARPPYPDALVDAVGALVPSGPQRVLDVGAGIGHLALPLAERGLDVTAVEPALKMLERLSARANDRGLRVHGVHAVAEALPFPDAAFELVVVADAVHFLDKELVALELARVLAPGGALAMVVSELGDTPFMRGVVEIMQASAPRRPRETLSAIQQIAKVARVPLTEQRFTDETAVDARTLERILGSISFIGPAMNAERAAAFRARIHALGDAPAWARAFTLYAGRRRR